MPWMPFRNPYSFLLGIATAGRKKDFPTPRGEGSFKRTRSCSRRSCSRRSCSRRSCSRRSCSRRSCSRRSCSRRSCSRRSCSSNWDKDPPRGGSLLQLLQLLLLQLLLLQLLLLQLLLLQLLLLQLLLLQLRVLLKLPSPRGVGNFFVRLPYSVDRVHGFDTV